MDKFRLIKEEQMEKFQNEQEELRNME